MIEITPLFSGSKGNSVYLKCKNTEILIDAGVSFRNLSYALEKIGTFAENISAVFVTHEHSDHIRGLEMFCKKHSVSIFINSASKNKITQISKNPFMCSCMKTLDANQSVNIGDICVRAFRTPHDAVGSVGYRIDSVDNSDSFSYCTDIGYVTRDIAKNVLAQKQLCLSQIMM